MFAARSEGPVHRAKVAEAESDFVQMFLSEAKLAARLTHPNIVQIFDFGDSSLDA